MPTISNATVATGTGLSTAGNGGRKLVRLSNGWLVAVIYENTSGLKFYRSQDNGNTWSLITASTNAIQPSANTSIVASGTRVLVISASTVSNALLYYNFDATSVGSTISHTSVNGNGGIDTGQSALGNVSLAIDEAGTELHAAWSSKNATYPNSFNIRYAKGTINGDGSVTWGAVEQVTTVSGTAQDNKNPSITLNKIQKPLIIYDYNLGTTSNQINLRFKDNNDSWVFGRIVLQDGYLQSSSSAIFVPTAINGLANGRLWVAWHGKDATDSAKFNVRVSYSDDGGVTWATPTKLTTGNLYDRQNVSLAADKTGKVFALYEEHQWSPDLDIYMRTFSGGSWGAPVAVAEADPAAESNPSALVDYSLMMTTPPFVFMSGTDGIKFSGNFNVGASVSPASGALGNKETATLTAYTVTPEAGSTVTSIVEKVNGVTVNTFNNPASLSRTLTVPTATWDTLAYFATHTASVTVTDSNGATTVTTYSFDKRLATGASLLEATKANTDAKNRISQKRDTLAAQVGLSAGSTFDAISAQLASGALKKWAKGTLTATGGYIVVSGLNFLPSTIVISQSQNAYPDATFYQQTIYSKNTFAQGGNNFVIRIATSSSVSVQSIDGTTYYVVFGQFKLPVTNNLVHTWIAYE